MIDKTTLMSAMVPALLLAACGGGTSDPDRDEAAPPDDDEPVCSSELLDEAAADGPVEVTFWYGMTGVPSETLEELIAEFNDDQDRVEVRLVNNNGYREQQENYRAGITTGDLPDLVQHQEVFLQGMIDTETAVPVQACIDDEGYDLDDYLARTVNYYVVEDVQWGMPFNVNTPVLVYDRVAFEDAGLDPDRPPETLDQLYDAAEALRDAGLPSGIAVKRDGWLFEQFRALQGLSLLDNANGRAGRAESVVFDDAAGLEILTVLNDLAEDDLVLSNPTEGPNAAGNLAALGEGDVGMTFDSSGVLGHIDAVLGTGQFPDVDPGVAPLPGRTDDGGALFGGAGLYISADDPVRQAAAWEVTKYLTSPEVQAVWAAETGFIPVRESSVDHPALQERWDEKPWFRVAYEQLLEGPVNEATAGPVLGEYPAYRQLVEETLRRMFEGDLEPEEALEKLAEDTDDLIAQYNRDVDI